MMGVVIPHADRARRRRRRALQILTDLGVDHVEDQERTVTTIRSAIDDLGRPTRMPE
ncbi:hypothetical protein WEH80_26800 [Actinomycetes bacterium KLBMP 9759]